MHNIRGPWQYPALGQADGDQGELEWAAACSCGWLTDSHETEDSCDDAVADHLSKVNEDEL